MGRAWHVQFRVQKASGYEHTTYAGYSAAVLFTSTVDAYAGRWREGKWKGLYALVYSPSTLS
jgi:hypothetical protein